MTSVKLKSLKDGQVFRLSERSRVSYSVQTKKGSQVYYTSASSGNTYNSNGNLDVFIQSKSCGRTRRTA
jgi:hypothetical protein